MLLSPPQPVSNAAVITIAVARQLKNPVFFISFLLLLLVKVCLNDWFVVRGDVGGFDAPLLRIEVVGTGADVLHLTEGKTVEGDSDYASWCLVGELEGFAAEVSYGLLVV